jgi:hypothetical protein
MINFNGTGSISISKQKLGFISVEKPISDGTMRIVIQSTIGDRLFEGSVKKEDLQAFALEALHASGYVLPGRK